MRNTVKGTMRRLRAYIRGFVVAGLAFVFANAAGTAAAQTQVSLERAPLVINNDIGGRLRVRLRQLAELRQESRGVRIQGSVCYSTCTMFLALEDTCVSPDTTFGFHGPSSYGLPLDPETFEIASQLIARHYPAPLKEWYLDTARHSIWRVHRIKGENLINIGVRAC